MSLPKLAAVVAAAALALVASSSTALATPPPAPVPPIVVQLCLAVTVGDVDRALTGVADKDLVGQLAPLAPLTVPDLDGLVLAPDQTITALHTTLRCQVIPLPGGPTTTPPTTVPPTTTPATTTTAPPTTAPPTPTPPATTTAPATSPTTSPTDDPATDDTQVRTIPIGGVATGDGSRAA